MAECGLVVLGQVFVEKVAVLILKTDWDNPYLQGEVVDYPRVAVIIRLVKLFISGSCYIAGSLLPCRVL